jgi:hypothetical protein
MRQHKRSHSVFQHRLDRSFEGARVAWVGDIKGLAVGENVAKSHDQVEAFRNTDYSAGEDLRPNYLGSTYCPPPRSFRT